MLIDMSSPRPSVLKTAYSYSVMISGTVLLSLWICTQGFDLVAPPPMSETLFGATRAGHKIDTLLQVLLVLVVILVAARIMGFIFRRLGQPPVIGEILAGILLGPSLLGRMAPEIYAFLPPLLVAPFLQVIAQVGVILYMFLVGLDLNPIIGLDLGVISSTLFVRLIIVALVTTFATAPVLDWITDSERRTSTLSAASVPS